MASKEVADMILRVLDGTEEFHLVAGITRDGAGNVTNHGNTRRSTTAGLAAYVAAGIVIPAAGISQAFADGRYLQKANNLSDVASAVTSRANLSVYSIAQVDALVGAAGGDWWKGHFPTTAILATEIHGGTAQAVTVTDDANVGMIFDSVDGAAGENFRVRYQAAPSNAASWAATCRVTPCLVNGNSNAFGIFSGTIDANKWAIMWAPWIGSGTFIDGRRMFSGGFLATDFNIAVEAPNMPVWLRIRWDQPSATYLYDMSRDGKKWRQCGTRTIAQLGFTPTHIGLGCYVNGAGPAYGSSDYWVVA